MSGKGNCYDNAALESFFKSRKAETNPLGGPRIRSIDAITQSIIFALACAPLTCRHQPSGVRSCCAVSLIRRAQHAAGDLVTCWRRVVLQMGSCTSGRDVGVKGAAVALAGGVARGGGWARVRIFRGGRTWTDQA